MIKGIHHVSALTKSFSENHHFYSDILGLRLVKKYSKSRQYSHAPPILRRLYRKPGYLVNIFRSTSYRLKLQRTRLFRKHHPWNTKRHKLLLEKKG